MFWVLMIKSPWPDPFCTHALVKRDTPTLPHFEHLRRCWRPPPLLVKMEGQNSRGLRSTCASALENSYNSGTEYHTGKQPQHLNT